MKTKTITPSYLRRQVSSVYRFPRAAGLQNTSLYSALWASLWLFTKTDGFSFEHHVFCDGPEGESQGCDE